MRGLIYSVSLIALMWLLVRCNADSGNDDSVDAKSLEDDDDAGNNPTDGGDSSNNSMEKECRKLMGARLSEEARFKPGVYHIFTYVYATNLIVNEVLKRPVRMNLWILMGSNKKDNPAQFCYTEADFANEGANCCNFGDDNCNIDVVFCIVELPDRSGDNLDERVPLAKNGNMKGVITNLEIPKEFDPALGDDAIGTVTLDVQMTSGECMTAKVDVFLSKVKIGSASFNKVAFRNYDIPDYSEYGYDYPSEELAVGWWERFYLGEEASIETPYPWEEAQELPHKVKTEPMCLDSRQVKPREF